MNLTISQVSKYMIFVIVWLKMLKKVRIISLINAFIFLSFSANATYLISKDKIVFAGEPFNGIIAPSLTIDQLPYKKAEVKSSLSLVIMGQLGNAFFEGNRFGYLFNRTQYGAFAAVGQIRAHQYIELNDQHTEDKDKAFEAGLQWSKPLGYGWVSQVSLFQDVSDTHHGQEMELAFYRRDNFDKFRLLTMFSAQQQSQSLTSYYTDAENYQADADLNFELELIGVYEITSRLNALMVYRHYLHGSGLKNSPLTQSDQTKRLILGLGWSF